MDKEQQNGQVKCVEDILPATIFEEMESMIEKNDDWTSKYSDKDLNIYSKKTEDDPDIKCIKSTFILDNTTLDLVYKLMNDNSFRDHWDNNFIHNNKICTVNENCEIDYYSIKSPIGISNRDTVFLRIFKLDPNEKFISINRSIIHTKIPEKSDFVRARIVNSCYLFKVDKTNIDSNRIKVSFLSQVNPNGRIPSWVVNFVSAKLAPGVVKNFKKACKIYPEWEKKQPTTYEERIRNENNSVPKVDWNDVQKI